jgi:hypothetical protein
LLLQTIPGIAAETAALQQRLPAPAITRRDVVNSEQKIFSSDATLFVDSL